MPHIHGRGRSLPPELIKLVQQDYRNGLSFLQIEAKHKVNRQIAAKYCRGIERLVSPTKTREPEEDRDIWSENDETAEFSCITTKPIIT